MNYKQGLLLINENIMSDGVFGVNADIGTHGGSVGNSDFYASGDARMPKVLGLGGNDPYENVKNLKNKKRKRKNNKIHIYRRTFAESTLDDIDIVLNCVIYTESIAYQQVIEDLLNAYHVAYEKGPDNVIIEGSDNYIRAVINKIQGVLTEDAFNDGKIVVLICEML